MMASCLLTYHIVGPWCLPRWNCAYPRPGHLSYILFWESGPCMVHYDPGYQGQTAPHNTKTQQTHQRKVGINVIKTNFTHHISGEIAHIPGLDTPKLHFVESGPYMCQHDPTNKWQVSSHNTKTEQDNQSTHQVDRLVKMHTSKACTHT